MGHPPTSLADLEKPLGSLEVATVIPVLVASMKSSQTLVPRLMRLPSILLVQFAWAPVSDSHNVRLELWLTQELPASVPYMEPNLSPSIHSDLSKTKIESCHSSTLRIKPKFRTYPYCFTSPSLEMQARPSFWTFPLSKTGKLLASLIKRKKKKK